MEKAGGFSPLFEAVSSAFPNLASVVLCQWSSMLCSLFVLVFSYSK